MMEEKVEFYYYRFWKQVTFGCNIKLLFEY